MKSVFSKKGSTRQDSPSVLSLFSLLCIICALCLSLICADCRQYEKEESLPVSITYTPPKKQESLGFWDIFSLAVTRIFSIEG